MTRFPGQALRLGEHLSRFFKGPLGSPIASQHRGEFLDS